MLIVDLGRLAREGRLRLERDVAPDDALWQGLDFRFAEPVRIHMEAQLVGHDVLVLHVLDDDELDFPFARPARFEGLETDDHLTCNPRALRESAYALFAETLRRNMRHAGALRIDHALFFAQVQVDQTQTLDGCRPPGTAS